MQLYINVAYWLTLIGLIVQMVMINGIYPRTKVIKLADDINSLVIYALFFIWLSYIKFNMS